ncbi:MAG: RIP metalloprotease RseP [Lachnospiraceae bacterium]|nr:RIP metalloprotease RseP [Lachnospiraceae bacterium]
MMGSMLLTVLIVSVIIVVHEFGHFLLAKKNGIEVVEFSVGFGPTLFAFERGGTRYALKLILFGGACQMTGENVMDEDTSAEIPENSFLAKSPWARFSVIAAGPIFNFLLAFILSVVVISVAGANPARVYTMESGSSAEAAGIQDGDIITTIDGKKIAIGRDIELYLIANPLNGEPIEVTWERDGEEYSAVLDTSVSRYMIGINYYTNSDAALIAVNEGYPAADAGLQVGDVILRIEDTEITDGQGINDYFNANPMDGSGIEIEYSRNGEKYVTELVPMLYEGYSLGFEAAYWREAVSPIGVLKHSFSEVRYWIENTLTSLTMLGRGQLGLNDVSGPVGVVSIVDEVVEESSSDGIKYVLLNLLNLTILLSANLGVLNLLPLPALDGGRLVFILIEAITGKPVSRKVEGIIHAVGIILLFGLMIIVLFKDLFALF